MTAEPSPDPVEQLVSTVQRGGPTGPLVRQVEHLLKAWLARRGLTDTEREEVINDAVHRLITHAEAGKLDPDLRAGGWLRTVADNLAYDAIRRRRPAGTEYADEHVIDAEDEFLRAIERTAAAHDVQGALREARADGKHQQVAIVHVWLALATQNGAKPSARDVAERLGISHPTVIRALKAFGERL